MRTATETTEFISGTVVGVTWDGGKARVVIECCAKEIGAVRHEYVNLARPIRKPNPEPPPC